MRRFPQPVSEIGLVVGSPKLCQKTGPFSRDNQHPQTGNDLKCKQPVVQEIRKPESTTQHGSSHHHGSAHFLSQVSSRSDRQLHWRPHPERSIGRWRWASDSCLGGSRMSSVFIPKKQKQKPVQINANSCQELIETSTLLNSWA